jgi:hypothetical protein
LALKGSEVAGGWRRLHNEEPNNLYASPNIIRVITSRMMRWVGHVACTRETRMHTIFWPENLRRRDYPEEDLGVDRKILEWILGKQSGKVCAGFI